MATVASAVGRASAILTGSEVKTTGTGTVTSSSCAYTYRYIPYLTTAQTDGVTRIS